MVFRTAAATAAMLLATPALSDEHTATGLASAPLASGPADWSGLFGGISLGAITSSGRAVRGDVGGSLLELDVQNGLFPSSIEDNETAAVGGVSLGYNRQRGRFVAGAAIDLLLENSNPTHRFRRIDPNPNPIFNGVQTITGYETELDGFAAARLRAGYAFGETLVFASGGLALGNVENSFSLRLPELGYGSPDWSEDGLLLGYVIGAGVERKITPRLSLKAEVLAYDLDDRTIHASDPANFPGETIEYEFRNRGQMGLIGINFMF